MIRCFSWFLLIGLVLAGPSVARDDAECTIDPPQTKPKMERAVSLKALQAQARSCQGRSNCSKSVLEMYGLTKIEGYVIDWENRDIVVFGAVEKGAPPLHTEDFVVALRNTAKRYFVEKSNGIRMISDPAVSIDPSPSVMARLDDIMDNANSSRNALDAAVDAWCRTCELPQDVSVLGIPFDTHFAKVMVDADYLMKRIVNGSDDLGLSGLENLNDTTMRLMKEHALNPSSGVEPIVGMTRFWFHPGANSYLEDEDVILIERSDVILLDEAEHLTRSGHIESAGFVNPLARKFSCAFSKHYGDIANKRHIYRELEGLFRWVSLARVLEAKGAFRQAGFDSSYLLYDFRVSSVSVPRTLPGIAEIKVWDHEERTVRSTRQISLRLPSCGGVSIAIDPAMMAFQLDYSGRLAALASRVLMSRPSEDAAFWDLQVG